MAKRKSQSKTEDVQEKKDIAAENAAEEVNERPLTTYVVPAIRMPIYSGPTLNPGEVVGYTVPGNKYMFIRETEMLYGPFYEIPQGFITKRNDIRIVKG